MPLRRTVPLQRGVPPTRTVPVLRKRTKPRRGPERSPEYLAWIRTLGCAVCSRVNSGGTAIEAAHTNALSARGIGQKTTDFSAIPLCTDHHREARDSYHRLGEQRFAQDRRIDLKELALRLQNRFWEQDVSASCAVHPR